MDFNFNNNNLNKKTNNIQTPKTSILRKNSNFAAKTSNDSDKISITKKQHIDSKTSEGDVEKTKSRQGLIGKIRDKFKNVSNIKADSKKAATLKTEIAPDIKAIEKEETKTTLQNNEVKIKPENDETTQNAPVEASISTYSDDVIKNLLKTIDNTPQDKHELRRFLFDFFQTDLKTGEKIPFVASEKTDILYEKCLLLSNIPSEQIKSMLKFSIEEAKLLDTKTPHFTKFVPSHGQDNIEIIRQRNLMEFFKARKEALGSLDAERYNREMSELCDMSREVFRKARKLINDLNLISNKDVDFEKLAYFCSIQRDSAIEYMLENNLFDPQNFSCAKDINEIFDFLPEPVSSNDKYDRTAIETMHKRGFFAKNTERNFERKDIVQLSKIPDSLWENVQKRSLVGFKDGKGIYLKPENIQKLARLTDEEFSNIAKRNLIEKTGYRQHNISELAKLSDEDWEKITNINIALNKAELNPTNISRLLSFDDNDRENIKKRGIDPVNEEELKFLNISNTTWDNIVKRNLNAKDVFGFSTYPIDAQIKLGALNDEAFENLKKRGLMFKADFKNNALEIAELNDDDYNLFLKRKLGNLEHEPFKTIKKLLQLTDEEFARIEEDILPFVKKYKYYEPTIPAERKTIEGYIDLAFLNEDEYDIVKEFLSIEYLRPDSQFEAHELKQIAKLDNKTRQKLQKILSIPKERGEIKAQRAKLEDLLKFCNLDEEKFKKLEEIIYLPQRQDCQFEADEIFELLALDDKDFNKARYFFFVEDRKNKQFSADDIKRLITMSKEELNKIKPYFSIKERGAITTIDDMIVLSKFNEAQKQRFQELIKIEKRTNYEQFNMKDIIKLSKLDDELYEKAKRFFYIEFNDPFNNHTQLQGGEIFKLIKYDNCDIDWLFDKQILDKIMDYRAIEDIIAFRKFENLENISNLSKSDKCDFLFKLTQYRNNAANIGELLSISAMPENDKQYAKLLQEVKPDFIELAKKNYFKHKEIPNVYKSIIEMLEYGNISNISELSVQEKRKLLNKLVKTNSDMFSLEFQEFLGSNSVLPKNKDEYCSTMKKLTGAIGIDTRSLSDETKADFYRALLDFEAPDAELRSFNFENPDLKIKLDYPREDFISDINEIISILPQKEQKVVCDYFGFDLTTRENSLILNGYPVNLDNREKLGEINNPDLEKIIEQLRPYVKRFTEGNLITIDNNPQLSKELNQITKAFPEFLTLIGKKQHKAHDYTLDIHTLKVLQGILNNPDYQKLPEADKTTLKIASLLHDLTKQEGLRDYMHPQESAYDAYYILEKLGLTEEEKIKIYQIIKNHNWLQLYNATEKSHGKTIPPDSKRIDKIAKDIAFELRQGNAFEMASILSEADMKAVKRDGKFFNDYKNVLEKGRKEIKNHITQIKESAIVLPQTKIPPADKIKTDGINAYKITTKTKSGKEIENIVLKLKPNTNLEQFGFEKNLISDDLNVLVHALSNDDQSIILQALGQIDSDALLSSSYINYKLGNYHVFRNQGFILDVDSNDINAGYYRDFGSGYKKDLDLLKNKYLFNGEAKKYRNYISDKIKAQLNLSDEEYRKLYPQIANKTIGELDKSYPDIAKAFREIFSQMEGGKRKHNRQYNEILITRPKIQGIFDYGDENKIAYMPEFLREYAAENNIPIIYFGK